MSENNDPLVTAEAVEPTQQAEAQVETKESTIAPEASETTKESSETTAQMNETQDAAEEAKKEVQDAIEDKSLSKAEREEKIKEAVEKYTLKIDGKEVHVESQDELVKLAQLGLAGHKRMQEAARMTKDAQTRIAQSEKLLEMLKNDPKSIIMHPELGIDPETIKKFAEEYLSGEIEKAQMTPEQRRLKELEEKLAAKEAEEKKREEEARQAEYEKLTSQYEAQYEKEIPDALQKAGLPTTPKTVAQVAHYLSTALEMGYELPISEAARRTKQDFIDWQKELYGSVGEDKILELLGEDVASKIRKADVSRFKVKDAPPTKTSESVAKTEENEVKPQKQTISDWLHNRRLGSWDSE